MPYTIAIAGTTGVGKSTLVKALAARLGGAAQLYFDAYKESTEYPSDMLHVLSQGETVDYAGVACPELCQHLMTLQNGQAIVDPWGRQVNPAAYIIVEEPFGRTRTEIGPLLDFVAAVQLPLDIALARRLVRDIGTEYTDTPAVEALALVDEFLQTYLGGMRNAYKTISDLAVAQADVVLDGFLPVSALVDEVVQSLPGSPVS